MVAAHGLPRQSGGFASKSQPPPCQGLAKHPEVLLYSDSRIEAEHHDVQDIDGGGMVGLPRLAGHGNQVDQDGSRQYTLEHLQRDKVQGSGI